MTHRFRHDHERLRRGLRRPGSGLVRTLVVATATLAILLVCFSIYQFSALSPAPDGRGADPRLPSPPTQPAGFNDDSEEAGGSVAIGQGRIGAGERAHISLYNPDGGRAARLEIDVRDWTPVAGASNEFLLSEPDIRMRTNDGHPVRITAQRGIMSAERKGDSGLDPMRGRLTGGVVIQYDRLSEDERAALPAEVRDRPDPDDLVQIDTEELEFDLEYSKLLVPGRLVLSARDIRMEAADLELRFNEVANRVEFLRIGGDGYIELKQATDELGLAVPGLDGGERRQSLAEWLRTAMTRQLQAGTGTPARGEETTGGSEAVVPAVTALEDGTPVFHPEGRRNEPASPPARYYARFEGDVSVVREQEAGIGSRLVADVLEVVRELTEADRRSAAPPQRREADRGAADTDAPAPSGGIKVTWAERLVVEACNPTISACGRNVRSLIAAEGRPLRLTHSDGEAVARRLSFLPESSEVELIGDESRPALVRGMSEGTLTALAIHTRREAAVIQIRAIGPGTFLRAEPAGAAAADGRVSSVAFADRMEASGRIVTERGLDRAGTLYTRERRLLDRTTFLGGVRMTHDETELAGDEVNVDFDVRRRGFFEHDQVVNRLTATGHVTMTRGDDRVSCRTMQIEMRPDDGGGVVPRRAIASGDVVAQQGDRVIRSRDTLVASFGPVVAPPDLTATEGANAGVPAAPAAEAGSVPGGAGKIELATKTGVTALEARGDVVVTDPAQGLDVTADSLDCTLQHGRAIAEALVYGLPDRPASVRLDTFTVLGQHVRLNAVEESAEVPGPGRLTFQSHKDLDGRKLDQPVPVSITWGTGMSYDGRESRARFVGNVHAVSQSETTFDCEQFEVQFDDVAPASTLPPKEGWILQSLMNRITRMARRSGEKDTPRAQFAKEPAYFVATGEAVAVISEFEPESGTLQSRARIAGPKLWVNLRPEVSKLMIEGAGNLLLEDFNVNESPESGTTPKVGGLFTADAASGPSTTLIEWRDLMWYDFSIEQTRFEGGVSLKHFSGEQLKRVMADYPAGSAGAEQGRATFLTSDILTVDFRPAAERTSRLEPRRMGRLSAGRLGQFQASGGVRLQDVSEGLSLTADRIVFWKDQNLLAIYGSPRRNAHIVKQRPGQLPHQVAVEHLHYNLNTGEWELSKPSVTSR